MQVRICIQYEQWRSKRGAFWKKFGFKVAATESKDVFENKSSDTAVVATRHDSHAERSLWLWIVESMFFVKNLCLTLQELANIEAKSSKHQQKLMIGFNRRFAPRSLR